MKSSFSKLKTYASFARRFSGRFIKERIEERQVPIATAPHRPDIKTWRDDRVTLAWLGHATVLINFYGTWLLTDPALKSHIGLNVGITTLGPRRLVNPALTIKELPSIDAILVSHAHMDHCDLGTLNKLPRRSQAVVQKGNRDLMRRFNQVTELAWGQSTEVEGIRIEAIEVNHWGARKLTDKHRGYGGFLIEKNGKAIVFGGDTAYTNGFRQLASRTKIDLAILPIGAYDPYIYAHANPEQSWAMAQQMGATYILPMHHSTFRLSHEPVKEPITRMLSVAGDERWRVCITEIGQTWVMPQTEESQTH
jgi:L-ascorbate metabolism protein UlaG (beta-lactamase superfamily)